MIPFSKVILHMIIYIINFVVLWINTFLNLSDFLDTYEPRTIMTGHGLELNKHCKIMFGPYIGSN